MKAFEYDSGPMRFANLLFDLTKSNLLWLVCCIPIVTIGAATSAQYATAGKLMAGDNQIFKNYKSGFLKHWKQSTLIWLAFLLLTAAFYMDYHLLTTAIVPAKKPLMIISFLAFVALVFIILWAFPVLTNYNGNIREILFNAFTFSFMYAPISLTAIAVYALVFYLSVRYLLVRVLFIVFGHALIVYFNLTLFRMVFKKYSTGNGDFGNKN